MSAMHHLFEPRNLVEDEIGRSAEPTQIGHQALNVQLGHSLKLGLVVVDDGGEQPHHRLGPVGLRRRSASLPSLPRLTASVQSV